MAKNRIIDPGLQYLQEIGFERIKGKYGLSDRLIKSFGENKAAQIWKKWESLSIGSKELYDYKNSDPMISKAFSEAFDGDIIRRACNYIASQKESFGSTILEVGCESGTMTGFLAKTFPDAKITAIDRSPAAVEIAKNKIKAWGIQNVEFCVASLEEVSEQFETVFCMRTIQENICFDEAPFMGEPLLSQFYDYGELSEEYTHQLINCLTEDGNLCIFERVGHDPLMCGWMMKLCLCKCAPDTSTYQEIQCEEASKRNTFQAFICRNNTTENPQKMVDLWYKAFQIDVTGKNTLTGWNALAYLSANAGKLIRGVRILNQDNEQVGRFALFYDKDDESLIYYLNAAGGHELQLLGFSGEKEEVLDHLQKTIDQNVQTGLHAEEIDPENDFVEGIDCQPLDT